MRRVVLHVLNSIKGDIKMKTMGLMLAGFGLVATALMAQMTGDRGQTSLDLSGGKVSVEYGRPALAGRDVKSMLQPGMEWRMGSNAATTLDTNIDLKFWNKTVAKGKYVLKARFVEEGKWLLLVTEDAKLVAEVPLTIGPNASPVENVTIKLEKQGTGGKLTVSWGTLNVAATFQKA
ncbi:MAG: DUF2911 domain-containing protein [Acidobacteria bacterium]|nr:DUF2911 domain-containing protein [Acidobacteriota bacterium]